jgi:hypothetical protein
MLTCTLYLINDNYLCVCFLCASNIISYKKDVNFTDNVHIKFDEDWDLTPRDGEQYVDIKNTSATAGAAHMTVQVTNLFGGNKLLGKTQHIQVVSAKAFYFWYKHEFVASLYICEPDTYVRTVSDYGLHDRAIEVRSPVEAKGFFL